jgi:2-polyprenyl-3-methyl-5-hydroxy-6-metoxy-1,4-benzoquinol methylase
MRILVAVPHVYDPAGSSQYGACGPDPSPRLAALEACVRSLRSTFTPVNRFLDQHNRRIDESEDRHRATVDIVICTTGSLHLLDQVSLSPDLYRREATRADPMNVPFECQRVLAEGLGSYDYYCYVEDDIVCSDPLLFAKLSSFTAVYGPGCLLQPNRFELTSTPVPSKVYIDGPCGDSAAPFQDVSDRPELTMPALADVVRFVRPANPNAGCYFLNAEQMEVWAARPDFLERDASFVGPIESAASLGIMRTFSIYKPSWENAGYLEVEHRDARWWWFGVANNGEPAPLDKVMSKQRVAPTPPSPASRYAREIQASELASDENAHVLAVLSVPPRSRVLDVGAADGSVARALVDRGCTVWGIEADEVAAARAKQVCEDLVVGDVELLDLEKTFRGQSFDVILLLDVLEHLKDPTAVLRRVGRLLTPQGQVIASIPNVAHGAVRLQLLNGRFSYTDIGLLDRTHLRFFDRSTVERMFREAGYIIQDHLRVRVGITETEIDVDLTNFPAEVVDSLQNDPDADTYQFIFVAVLNPPGGAPPTSISLAEQLQHRLHDLERELSDARAHDQELESRLHESEIALAEADCHRRALEAHISEVKARKGYVVLDRTAALVAKAPVIERGAKRMLRRLGTISNGASTKAAPSEAKRIRRQMPALVGRRGHGRTSDFESLTKGKLAIAERWGPWTAHNIYLGNGCYTISDRVGGNELLLRRVVQAVMDIVDVPHHEMRVLDLGCLEGLYAVELARRGASRVVGVEGRETNIERARFVKDVLGLDNLELVQDDVRNVRVDDFGHFEVVLCLGLLYHLDAPDVFSFAHEIGRVCDRVAVIDTHVALSEAEIAAHDPSTWAVDPEHQLAPLQPRSYEGQTYWGRSSVEHAPGSSLEERLANEWASLDNVTSFTLTRSSLVHLLAAAGFTTVSEMMLPAFGWPPDRATFVATKGTRQRLLTAPGVESFAWTEGSANR